MTKKLMTAVLTAGALVLAGCGSDAGTAAPAVPGGATAAPATAGATTAPVTSAQVDDSEPAMTEGSSDNTAESSPAETSMEQSVEMPATTTGDDDSAGPATGGDVVTDETTSSSAAAAQFDDATIAWMTTFCTGFSTLSDNGEKVDDADATEDPAGYAAALTATGDGMTSLAGQLAPLPAPTFTNGDKVAGVLITVFSEYGPKFTAAGAELSGQIGGDAATVKAAAEKAEAAYDAFDDDAGDAFEGLGSLNESERAAVQQIEACAPMFG